MRKSFTPWFLAVGLVPLWLAGCGQSAAPNGHTSSSKSTHKPTKTTKAAPNKASNKLKVIAFYDQSQGTVTPDPFALVKAHPGIVTYLAPFWYEVSATGSIISKPEGNAATLAHQDHLPLMPLFTNAGGTDAFLHSASTRTTAIDHIVSLLKSKKYPGLNIDFQGLKAGDRTDLTDFMTSLKKAVPSSTSISMSVVPLTSGNGESSAYDYASLDKLTDSMVLMAYDLHGNGTPPGPVSPFPWVEKSITTALKAGIKPSKLYLGIADYGYLWTNGSTKATTIPLKVMHQHKYGVYKWNPTDKEAYDKYTSKGVSHIIWFVNDRAAKDRIDLAKKDHLGGVAFWRLGYEDAQWWDTISKAIGSTSGSTTAKSSQAAKSPASPNHVKKAVKGTANKAADTVKGAGDKAKNKLKGPVKKTVIAPAHKVKHTVDKAAHKTP